MKVYLNRKPRIGPWGGGNKSLSLLCQKLKKLSHEVVFDLNNGDIDIIFCYDPRPNETGEWYQSFLSYRQNNPKCKIIQRVGDAGTHGKPELTSLVSESAKYSDFLIFPSFWVKNYIEFTGNNFTVIPNRPPSQFFQFRENRAIGKKIKEIISSFKNYKDKVLGYDQKIDQTVREYCEIIHEI